MRLLIQRLHWHAPHFVFDLRCRIGWHRWHRPFPFFQFYHLKVCQSCGERRAWRTDIFVEDGAI